MSGGSDQIQYGVRWHQFSHSQLIVALWPGCNACTTGRLGPIWTIRDDWLWLTASLFVRKGKPTRENRLARGSGSEQAAWLTFLMTVIPAPLTTPGRALETPPDPSCVERHVGGAPQPSE